MSLSVALVTGGASGLGLGTVKRFLKCGRKVVFCDLPTSDGAKIADELGDDVLFVPCDVTTDSDVKSAVLAVKQRFGRLDICVNCAGIFIPTPVFDFEKNSPGNLDDFIRVYNVNVIGTWNVIRHSVGLMAENEPDSDGQRGVIINTSSITSFEGQSETTAYASSKAAINGMTLPLARELGPKGIRVMAIAPGYMRTPILGFLDEKGLKSLTEIMAFPKQIGEPDDFADLCESIIRNRLLNGSTIRIDGCTTLRPNYK